jgi:hypothetical protein
VSARDTVSDVPPQIAEIRVSGFASYRAPNYVISTVFAS